jgi:ABC-type branched-subunit amino acid transport system permease subunit
MMDVLQGIGYGIVALAVLVVVGLVVITKLGDSTASCATAYTYDTATRKCLNSTGGDPTDPTNGAWTNSNYLMTQLGSSGLSGWVPSIIAVAIGALFLSYFMGRRR